MRFTSRRLRRDTEWLGQCSLIVAGAFALTLGSMVAANAATEVRVVLPFYSAKTGQTFEAIAKEFSQANPGIEIKIEVVTWSTLFQKLTTDIAGGRPPDISIIATRWLADFVTQGIAEPLDAYMPGPFRDAFIETFLTPSVIDGKTYGLPVAASVRALYYNKELFARAGIGEAPETWQALRTAAGKVSALGGEVYGFGLQGKESETDAYWYYALWSFGGELVDANGSGVASAAGIKAAKFYKRMIDDGVTQPGVTNYSRADLQNLFKQGRLGMVLTGPWLLGQLKREAPKLRYGVAAIPKGTRRATYGVTDSIIMFKSSKVKDAAWMFLKAAYAPKWRSTFSRSEGFLPVLKSVAVEPHFRNDEGLAAFTAMLPFAKFAPTLANWEEMADAISRALQTVYLGAEPAEKALGRAAKRVDKLLGR